MNHRIPILVVLACTLFGAVAHGGSRPDPKAIEQRNAANRRVTLATIRSTDLRTGVTKLQAEAIARLYFQSFISGCGAAQPPVEKATQWHITPMIGIAGTPAAHSIIIEKHTGRVSWHGGPTFVSLGELLKAAP